MRKSRLLLTGFSAFPGARRNPTETLIENLDVKGISRRFGVQVVTVILPAEYAAVAETLPRLWQDVVPDAAIHLGLHGRARAVHVERRAINYASPIRPDACGIRPPARISRTGPAAHRSTVPVERIEAAIAMRGVPVLRSHDAGSYVCNYACYLSLEVAPPRAMAGFIHLPWPSEVKAPRAPANRPSWAMLGLAVDEAIKVTCVVARSRQRVGV